jgi:hypothetical protein
MIQWVANYAATGDILAVVAKDDGYTQLSSAAKQMFATKFGAAQINSFAFRGSYALVSQAGASTPLAETVKASGNGPAIAIACAQSLSVASLIVPSGASCNASCISEVCTTTGKCCVGLYCARVYSYSWICMENITRTQCTSTNAQLLSSPTCCNPHAYVDSNSYCRLPCQGFAAVFNRTSNATTTG